MIQEILISHILKGELKTIGERVRMARSLKGWSQVKLAHEARVTRGVIEKLEQGKSRQPRQLENIARALELAPSLLRFGRLEDIGFSAEAIEVARGLSEEALEVARAWSILPEPYRSALRNALLHIAKSLER